MPSIPGITLRSFQEGDLEFLFQVYASTRWEELAPVPWTDEQKAAFLHMQATAQHAYYQENYRGADWLVIEREGRPAGRLYVHRREKEIRLVDIALLPEHRGSGIGTDLLQELIAESAAAGKPLRIHVEKNNPALRLYERLGFVPIVDKGVYHLMERAPGPN
jgi:ribosomal protein S18 acetylase RimI-like enzyme